jgi:hypothetical protein
MREEKKENEETRKKKRSFSNRDKEMLKKVSERERE